MLNYISSLLRCFFYHSSCFKGYICAVNRILFYSILFYSILFYSILFYSILFYSCFKLFIRRIITEPSSAFEKWSGHETSKTILRVPKARVVGEQERGHSCSRKGGGFGKKYISGRP